MSIIDIMGIVTIFAAILYIGWKATCKTGTAEEFLMANRALSKWQVGLSMAASDFGGNGVVGGVAFAYTCGLAGGWFNWGAVLPLLILALLIAKQLRGINIASVPELLGKRYCSSVRLISTIAQLLATGAVLGIQFTVAAASISAMSGLNYNLAIIISVIIVVAYTMGGGLNAVVNTDMLQFFVVTGSIILAVPLCLRAGGGWGTISASLPPDYLNFGSQGILVPISLGLLYMFDYATSQHILQRVFSAKDAKTASFAFTFTGIIYVFYGLAIAFLGTLAFVLLPNLADTNLAYSMLIKNYLPSGIRGLSLGGVFAASMACADSKILAATTLFVNDVYKPYIKKNENVEDQKVLNLSRIVTVVVSLLGVGIAMFSGSLVQMLYIGGLAYGTSVFIPMLAAIYWKRGTAQGALISMIAAMATGLFWEFFISGKVSGTLGAIPSNIVAVTVSLVLFVLISLLTPRPSKEQLEILNDTI